jgi:cyclopropane fatty-acyl-phospholipid synthase-like methyltransferase
VSPFLTLLKPSEQGLDFGCGQGPALAAMLRGHGFSMTLYDPFFYPDESALLAQYDFITCTETAEHFHDPFAEFDKLDSLLKPHGRLGVMTCFLKQGSNFETWHYRRDPTHVVFYCETSFKVIAAQRGWQCQIPAKDIVLLSKP